MPTTNSSALTEVLAATSMLDAVNILLKSIGEAPVNTLDGEGSIDAESAFGTLVECSRQVQGLGWHFNTDIGLKLLPETDSGFVRLPSNTLRVDEIWAEAISNRSDIVQRGLRLYDRRLHTFALNRPVIVNTTSMLSFEELPQYARTYIVIKAARKFAQDETVSESLYKFSKTDENDALVTLEQADAENEGSNMALKSPFIRGMLRRS